MVNGCYVDQMAMGINWLDADQKLGISPKIQYEIESGEVRFGYPEPEDDLQKWLGTLTTEQAYQAKCDYHNRWTWETGLPRDKEVLDAVEEEVERRGKPPLEGDAYFDTVDQTVYICINGSWEVMSRTNLVDD